MSLFYCFSAMSSIMYMHSLLLSVLINIAVNEMSDEQEVLELIENQLGSWLLWPSRYLTLGNVFAIVPITIFEIYTHDFGLYAIFHRTGIDSTDLLTKVLCVTTMVLINGIVVFGFFNRLPAMICKVYLAKVSIYTSICVYVQEKVAKYTYVHIRAIYVHANRRAAAYTLI